ncbi:MAG: hypothetical protein ACD_10C00292G0003, partial [uncultured bacterium]
MLGLIGLLGALFAGVLADSVLAATDTTAEDDTAEDDAADSEDAQLKDIFQMLAPSETSDPAAAGVNISDDLPDPAPEPLALQG